MASLSQDPATAGVGLMLKPEVWNQCRFFLWLARPNGLEHHCCFPGSPLKGSWSQGLELSLNPGAPEWDVGILTAKLNICLFLSVAWTYKPLSAPGPWRLLGYSSVQFACQVPKVGKGPKGSIQLLKKSACISKTEKHNDS